MKTAVIITGHMRSFDQCLPRLAEKVFNKLGDVDFFVSTITDEDSASVYRLREMYPDRRVLIENFKRQDDCIAHLRSQGCKLPSVWERGKPYMRERYPISVHPQSVARQLWQLEKGWGLFTTTAAPGQHWTHAGFDLVVRCRPDLWIHGADLDDVSKVDTGATVYTPWWGRFDGVNDRFAIMTPAAAPAYFTTYSQIPAHLANGTSLHPETLVKASLKDAGCVVMDNLPILFSTRRTNGEMRPPEIINEDLQHLANPTIP